MNIVDYGLHQGKMIEAQRARWAEKVRHFLKAAERFNAVLYRYEAADYTTFLAVAPGIRLIIGLDPAHDAELIDRLKAMDSVPVDEILPHPDYYEVSDEDIYPEDDRPEDWPEPQHKDGDDEKPTDLFGRN